MISFLWKKRLQELNLKAVGWAANLCRCFRTYSIWIQEMGADLRSEGAGVFRAGAQVSFHRQVEELQRKRNQARRQPSEMGRDIWRDAEVQLLLEAGRKFENIFWLKLVGLTGENSYLATQQVWSHF